MHNFGSPIYTLTGRGLEQITKQYRWLGCISQYASAAVAQELELVNFAACIYIYPDYTLLHIHICWCALYSSYILRIMGSISQT